MGFSFIVAPLFMIKSVYYYVQYTTKNGKPFFYQPSLQMVTYTTRILLELDQTRYEHELIRPLNLTVVDLPQPASRPKIEKKKPHRK